MMDTVAIIPTMLGRENVLVRAVESLVHQVDGLYIYINDYQDTPVEIASLPNAYVLRGADRGSAARFCLGRHANGYLAFCDDDLLYPPDYVAYLKQKVDQYDRKCVITLHGKLLNPMMYSFFGLGHGRIRKGYPCLETVIGDHEVHMSGTGALMYHSDALDITEDDFKENNLDDAEFSILCQNRGVVQIVADHQEKWLRYLKPTGRTIWEDTVRNPIPLLRLLNSHQWKFYTDNHD
jgi:hypothetical protein